MGSGEDWFIMSNSSPAALNLYFLLISLPLSHSNRQLSDDSLSSDRFWGIFFVIYVCFYKLNCTREKHLYIWFFSKRLYSGFACLPQAHVFKIQGPPTVYETPPKSPIYIICIWLSREKKIVPLLTTLYNLSLKQRRTENVHDKSRILIKKRHQKK